MSENNTVFDDDISQRLKESSSEQQYPFLMVLEGGDIKGRYRIDRPEMFIGRDLTCDLVLHDTKSSRRHVRIEYQNISEKNQPPKILMNDMGSTNGTFVNGMETRQAELRDRDKILIGSTLLGYFLHDESTLKAEQLLVQLASTDHLTGLRNRAVFDIEIDREFSRARRYGRDLSLVMLDIDHFKNVNDTHGHPAGDEVLKEFAKVLMMGSRSNDLVSRYGGEEFAIILPETRIEAAMIHAERLRKVIAAQRFQIEGAKLAITASLGVCGMGRDMVDCADFIKSADQALYRAKAAGRNQVQWNAPAEATGSMPPLNDDPTTR